MISWKIIRHWTYFLRWWRFWKPIPRSDQKASEDKWTFLAIRWPFWILLFQVTIMGCSEKEGNYYALSTKHPVIAFWNNRITIDLRITEKDYWGAAFADLAMQRNSCSKLRNHITVANVTIGSQRHQYNLITYTLCRFVCVEKTPSGREVILLKDKSLRKKIDQENYYKV